VVPTCKYSGGGLYLKSPDVDSQKDDGANRLQISTYDKSAVDGRVPTAYNEQINFLPQRNTRAAADDAQPGLRKLITMVLLEMSITPLGIGDSVSQYVAQCVDLVDQSGLDYELHAMGTIVEGELEQVLDLMRRCIEQVAGHSDRVTCVAKLDLRRGQSGRIRSKVASVEQKLGRPVRKGS
jgi:uncharacterized protein (TIGR00106 family)